ncbi:hypothetical protein P691DRAFT_784929 [Macrolepiota fuliginosa MF-IS2]|uniref:NACHT domain-containing protein n=1 Tax=Macrolepiota fuliginosa MF-IS2 TaxID=1400762 RepID=A0A9P5X955_9AGAR|nr:hypothetical protein P691DRAFT_784929 [Macrolepiota fuliginosa MF-IS2]
MRREKRKKSWTTGNSSGGSPDVQGRKKKQRGVRGPGGQDRDLRSSRSGAINQTHAGSFGGAHNFTISSLTMMEGGGANERKSIKLLSEHIIIGAEFDSSDHRPSCHPETRLNISRNIQAWMHNLARKYKILWLNGPAGVGKSAILQTIAEVEADSTTSILGATLFFSRPNERNDPQRVFITIAYRLSMRYPAYRTYIVELLDFDPTMVKKSMQEQFKAFIVQPFAIKELLAGTQDTVLILLDGLDECEGDDAQREIIHLIAKFALQYPTSPLIWLIASRPESHIQDTFTLDAVRTSYEGMQVDIDSDEGCNDVRKYLRDNFADIRERHWRSIPSSLQQWPSESDFTTIATQSSGLFIFSSTLIRFIGDENYADPNSRLKIVLDITESTTLSHEGKNPFATLDALYTYILSEVPPDVLKTTLSLLAFYTDLGGWPFALNCNRLGVSQGRAYGALRRLHSVLQIPKPVNAFRGLLEPFHASFYDYLSSPSRSGTFYIGSLEIVQPFVHRLIDILLESHSVEMSDVATTRINLSWPDQNEVHRQDHQRDIFCWALNSLTNILDKFVNDSIRKEFSRLSAFFQDLDFGEVFSKDLENWGVLKTVPLQSFNYDDIRPDLNPAIKQCTGERDDVSLRLVWSEGSGPARLTNSFYIVDSRGKRHRSEVSSIYVPDYPKRNSNLEKNLAAWTSMAPSHPVVMLGKGRKSCAVIQFYVPGEGLWLVALPCVQPS